MRLLGLLSDPLDEYDEVINQNRMRHLALLARQSKIGAVAIMGIDNGDGGDGTKLVGADSIVAHA